MLFCLLSLLIKFYKNADPTNGPGHLEMHFFSIIGGALVGAEPAIPVSSRVSLDRGIPIKFRYQVLVILLKGVHRAALPFLARSDTKVAGPHKILDGKQIRQALMFVKDDN